jgi:ketosteroid isomerase-like protein
VHTQGSGEDFLMKMIWFDLLKKRGKILQAQAPGLQPGMRAGMRRLLVLALMALFAGWAEAQTVPPLESIQSQAELDKAITTLDAALFDSYNRCDLEKFATFFVDDVEFYHDQGGVTLGRAALTESVKKNICGKTARELVPGTLQVYYMKGYGAVEMGVHRFHHPGHEDTEGVGEGKFIHLWQYKDGAWKITRAISYDHHAAAK